MNIRRKHMRLIKQKASSDCAICCFAMLTGIPHKKVIKMVGDTYDPAIGMSDTDTALLRLGFKERTVRVKGAIGAYRVYPVDFTTIRKPHEISANYFKEQIWGRRALLTVPSLNHEGGWHMVYWHYDRLYDPSTKKTYKDFSDVQPVEIVLFSEKLD